MSAFSKPVPVLVISILIFAGIACPANNQLADFVQTHFYNTSIVNSYVNDNAKDAEICENHILYLQRKFARTLEEPAVRGSFHYNQDLQDIFERSRIFRMLLESTEGLQSVQFIHSNGIRMHYSTSSGDIITQDADSISYRNYTEVPGSLPFDTVSVLAHESPKYTLDDQWKRIIFSYPFVDSMDVYRGTSLFFVSVRALAEKLIAEGRMKVTEDVTIVSPGILLGSSDSSNFNKVSQVWNDGKEGRIILDDSGVKFSLISFKTDHGLFFGHLVNDSLFSISNSMKLILCLSMFLTFYLTLFFFVNFKPNPVTVVQNRLAHLRENLFRQLYATKNVNNRVKWIPEIEQRRDEIRSELKSNLKLNRLTEKAVDDIIDKSWDELLAVMKTGSSPAVKTVKPQEARVIEEVTELEELEGIDEAEELEELEEFEEIEETPSESKITNANIKIPDDEQRRKGLLALATEAILNCELPVIIDEPETDDEVINTELDIVSPFDTMFSSLEEEKPEPVKKEKKPGSRKKSESQKKPEPAKKSGTRKKSESEKKEKPEPVKNRDQEKKMNRRKNLNRLKKK